MPYVHNVLVSLVDIWQEIVTNACCDKEVITVCKLDENQLHSGWEAVAGQLRTPVCTEQEAGL